MYHELRKAVTTDTSNEKLTVSFFTYTVGTDYLKAVSQKEKIRPKFCDSVHLAWAESQNNRITKGGKDL